MDLTKIAGNMLKCVATGELCRLWAKTLSDVKPQLDAHNVRLVGVGLEELGVEAFVEGGFFNGELFIDLEKKSYKDLEFKRYNVLTVLGALAAKETRHALSKSNALGIKGDMKGDGMQNGGDLVVSKGGDKVLLFHKQANPGNHPEISDILKALSIEPETKEKEEEAARKDEATEEVGAAKEAEATNENEATEEAGAAKKQEAAEGTDPAKENEAEALKGESAAEAGTDGSKESKDTEAVVESNVEGEGNAEANKEGKVDQQDDKKSESPSEPQTETAEPATS